MPTGSSGKRQAKKRAARRDRKKFKAGETDGARKPDTKPDLAVPFKTNCCLICNGHGVVCGSCGEAIDACVDEEHEGNEMDCAECKGLGS